MTTASITTDINFGPYKIPSNAQNMIMNNFASRNALKVELVIPEPIMSDQLETTQWLNEEFNFQNIHFFTKYSLILFMIIGRIELLTLLLIMKKYLFKN